MISVYLYSEDGRERYVSFVTNVSCLHCPRPPTFVLLRGLSIHVHHANIPKFSILNSSQRSLFSLLSSQYSLLSPLPIQYHPYRLSSLFSLSCTESLTFWLEQQSGTLLITFPAAHGGTVLRYRIRRQARACTHLCKPHEYSLHTCVNLLKCSNSSYTHDPEHIQSIRIEGGTRGGR